ncbi:MULTISPECIES: hypothetical protein [unclassified Rhodococcus (in: high G+C Gram-positive bacteria)]|uniref:hypothetical protein n=1 Tax=unclassified Rhodococcus (in: high G+C Gram-positive bacteria) TaxID=192944 RepID=UPI00117A8687|nr:MULTISPECIES: hypothetical protein [unclassified Rhodococcus (in: high G+C Gram-positive bacteria)]
MTAPTTHHDADQIEFCKSCAKAARIRSDARWSVGPTYRCPTCDVRFTWHYRPDPADDAVLTSICTTL